MSERSQILFVLNLISSSSCTLVITDGPNPLTSLTYDHVTRSVDNLQRTSVPVIPQEEIVDSIGAGDSFVAGYLHGNMLGKSSRECIQHGVSMN